MHEMQEELPKGYYGKIIFPDRTPITIEIHTEADWATILSHINATRESWKKKHAEK